MTNLNKQLGIGGNFANKQGENVLSFSETKCEVAINQAVNALYEVDVMIISIINSYFEKNISNFNQKFNKNVSLSIVKLIYGEIFNSINQDASDHLNVLFEQDNPNYKTSLEEIMTSYLSKYEDTINLFLIKNYCSKFYDKEMKLKIVK